MTAYDPQRPFSRAEALYAGLTDLDLKRYVRIMHGIYIAPGHAVTPLVRAEAALFHFGARAYASHQTAARIRDIPVPDGPEHVSTPEKRHLHRRTHVVAHRAEAGQRIVEIGGVRVAPITQMYAELGTELSLVDLVVAGDAILAAGFISADLMTEYLRDCVLNGAVAARRAWTYVRHGAESPMESRARMLVVLAGLPEPEPNITVLDRYGTRRHDLRWATSKTVLEYDGEHHLNPTQWRVDIRRRRDSDDAGWRTVTWIAKSIYSTPGESLAHLHRTLLERGEPGIPRRLRSSWRRHFPDRDLERAQAS